MQALFNNKWVLLYLRPITRLQWAIFCLLSVLFLLSLHAIAAGAFDIKLGDLMQTLLLWARGEALSLDQQVLLQLRLPRLFFAMLVGAGLATAGVASQGLFQNPLADPAMIGVASGAALGASCIIVLGSNVFNLGHISPGLVATGAFIGGLISSFLVWIIGQYNRSIATLLLAGIAINAIAFAAIGLLQYLANDQQLRDLTFWSLGSLSAASWQNLIWVAPAIVVSMIVLFRQRKVLNALLLGEHEAKFLGFCVKQAQHKIIFFIALSVSSAVAFTGVISFVGLVVPHLLRLILGPDHRLLLPCSALGGAILVVAADLLARTLISPAELPLGVLISLLGGPFFLYLLLRTPLFHQN